MKAVLLKLALNYVIEKILSRSVIYKFKQISAYSDDIALVARNMDAMKGIFLDLGKECKKIGLAVNVRKKKNFRISQ